MNTKPKISILTPSYNTGKYLERAIKSVLDQDYDNWEHIVVDGGSTDNTLEILKKYPHIQWVSEPDKGQSDAMNKAFTLSSGSLISYLNADDYYQKNAFNVIVNFFLENPRYDMVVGNLYVYKNGQTTSNTNATVAYSDLRQLKGRFPLNPVSYFYKKEVQEKVGQFPVDEHYAMDYWFLLRAFYFFEIKKIDDLLGTFYFSGENKTASMNSFVVQRKIALSFMWKHDKKGFFMSLYPLIFHKRDKITSKYFSINSWRNKLGTLTGLSKLLK